MQGSRIKKGDEEVKERYWEGAGKGKGGREGRRGLGAIGL
jgi:hypothetical protein